MDGTPGSGGKKKKKKKDASTSQQGTVLCTEVSSGGTEETVGTVVPAIHDVAAPGRDIDEEDEAEEEEADQL